MKKALITGASRGIGLETAKKLLKENFEVFAISRKKPNFEDKNFHFFKGNVNNKKNIEKLSEKIDQLDLLILNAGVGYFEYLDNLKDEKIEEMINTNLLAPIFWTKRFLDKLEKNKARIVFICSESALKAEKTGSVYCASKAGLRMFASVMSQELSKKNIKTTILNPGMVDNSFFDDKNFYPETGQDTTLQSEDVADFIVDIANKREGMVVEEISFAPMRRSLKRR